MFWLGWSWWYGTLSTRARLALDELLIDDDGAKAAVLAITAYLCYFYDCFWKRATKLEMTYPSSGLIDDKIQKHSRDVFEFFSKSVPKASVEIG